MADAELSDEPAKTRMAANVDAKAAMSRAHIGAPRWNGIDLALIARRESESAGL